MLFGSIFDSILATEILRIHWLSGESSSVENQFDCGAINLDLNMPPGCVKNHQGYGDTFFIDEVFIKIDGRPHYLWRAVDQDGDVVDMFLQKRRNAKAAKRFFVRLLKKHKGEPRKIVTDKLRSYDVAHREITPESIHVNDQYANNRAELSHQPTRVRERGMRGFKSIIQAQHFIDIHASALGTSESSTIESRMAAIIE